MICIVRNEANYRRRFPVVLLCKSDGLYRLYKDARQRPWACGYIWPVAENLQNQNKSLVPHVPKMWGVQRNSACIIEPLPRWLFRPSAGTNLGRLLLTWFQVSETVFRARSRTSECELLPGVELWAAPVWHPVAITIIANTDVVVKALHSGALLERLKLGLERIYISEFSWIRAPSIEASIKALAARFPEKLVLVKAKSDRLIEKTMGIRRPRAVEYQLVGRQLQDRYEDDFGCGTQGMFKLRVGDVPRGSTLLWTHQLRVEFEKWTELTIVGLSKLQIEAKGARDQQNKRASKLLANHFGKNTGIAGK
jgi:hypothetical protein